MNAAAAGSVAAASGALFLNGEQLAVVLLGAVFLLAAMIVALLWSGRRQAQREVRELVVAIEEMRSGCAGTGPDVTARSELALVADAVRRLGQDLSARTVDVERARGRLRAVLDAAPDTAVVTTDLDGVIESVNEVAEEMFGWVDEELAGEPASALMTEEGWKDLLPKLARRSVGYRGVVAELEMCRREGDSFLGEVRVRVIRDASGEPVGYLGIVRDVTRRATLELSLEDAERRHRRLLDGLPEPLAIVREGRVKFANRAMAERLGVAVGELGGRALHDWVDASDVLAVRDLLDGVADAGGGAADRVLEVRLRGPEATRPSPGNARLRVAAFGDAVAVFFERPPSGAEFDSRFSRSARRLDAILDSTSDGVLALTGPSGSGRVEVANRGMAALLGMSTEELVGRRERDLVDELAERGGLAARIGHALAGEAVSTPDDADELIRVAALADRDGAAAGRIVLCRDVSEMRRPERELAAQADALRAGLEALEEQHGKVSAERDRIAEDAADLERFNRDLHELDDMKSKLLANVTHELQAPLVSVRGFTEMILRERLGPVTDEQVRGLEVALKNIDRLISMIDGLLEFSRFEREVGTLDLSRFALADLVRETLDRHAPDLESAAVRVEVGVGESIVVRADRVKIGQVFDNLVGNAIKFAGDDPAIEIAAQRGPEGFIAVEVRDRGPGIPQSDLERVFERGYRSRTDVEKPGSGLGLAIVRDLLRLHGCMIRATSPPNEGAVFWFTLPDGSAADAPADAPATVEEAEAARAVEAPAAAEVAPVRPRLRIIRPAKTDPEAE